MRRLGNFLGFQLGWWACALGAAHGRPRLGPLVMGVFLLAEAAARRPRVPPFLALCAAALLFGAACDTALIRRGALAFAGAPTTPPPWMLALWAGFAATLDQSLGWLRGRPVLAALVGAASGPIAYRAGASLGALTLPPPSLPGAIAIALAWAVALPLLCVLCARLEPRR